MRDVAQVMEQIHFLPQVREALGFKSNRTLIAACVRHGVPIVTLSSKSKALRHSHYQLLLDRATGAIV
jgi:hypothetical protein